MTPGDLPEESPPTPADAPAWARPEPGVSAALPPTADLAEIVRASPPKPPAPTRSAEPAARSRRPRWWPIPLTAAIAAIAGGLIGGGIVALTTDSDTTTSPVNGATTRVTVEETSAVIEVARRARPSVVKIESTRRVQGGIERDVGSGVVIDDQGHIVTNAHVILGTETLKVILADGTERTAILIGHDYPFTDIAVLQVGPGAADPVAVGDSSKLALGQTVVAIGNPLAEFAGSVNAGVVSGLGRRRTFDSVLQEDLIQTDVALNHGNSGGALLNLSGELIGIPTAVLREDVQGQAVEGIAFAIPSNRLMEVARGIIAARGAIERPSLGAEHVDLTAEIVVRNRLTAQAGALITTVVGGGASSEAGIAPGDIVIKIANDDVNRELPMLNALMKHVPGETVRVVLNRGGRIIELDVRLGKRS